jgi:ligand-binding sensor domain-containing protein
VGTENGLAHLVGGHFRSYGPDQGLPSPFVTALALAPDGALLVGTAAGVG